MITDLESAIKHYEIEAEVQEKLYRLCPASESKLFYCDGTKDCKAVKKGKNKGCLKCAEEHRQLAEWLRELKMWRAYGRRNKDKLPEDMQLMKALNEEVNTDG